MDRRFGNFDVGKDADVVLVEVSAWERLARILEEANRSEDDLRAAEKALVALLLGLREPAVTAVFVQGLRISSGPVR